MKKWLFKMIHYHHFKDGKTEIIKVLGIRKARLERQGQRSISILYWKIGKYYI